MNKHGYWTDNRMYLQDGWVGEGYYIDYDYMCCSSCHKNINKLDNCIELFNYCPNCGARMDGDKAKNDKQ